MIKILWMTLMILWVSSSLEAYTKQIVLENFKDKESAESALQKLKSDLIYEKLGLIAKENGFTIHTISSGGSTKLVAEPIKNKFIEDETLKLVQPMFNKATAINVEKTVVEPLVSEPVVKSEPLIKAVAPTQVYPQGYPKKILMGTFSSQIGADKVLQEFKKDASYEELFSLSKEKSFVIHVRPLGTHHILTAEPFKEQSTFENAMKLVKSKFKEAYGTGADAAYMQTDEIVEKNETLVIAPIKKEETKKVDTNKTQLAYEPVIKAQAKKVDTNISASKKEIIIDQMLIKPTMEEKNTTIKETNTTGSITQPLVEDNNSQALVMPTVEIEKVQEVKIEKETFVDTIFKLFHSKQQDEAVQNPSKKETSLAPEEIIRERDDSFSIMDYILFLLFAALMGAAVHYGLKFKKIYDEY
ncbi:MAG: hypothetical protein NTZ60_05770 [Campylobacterales bacterium]|nr:hypothetical protein [Campylobacterales bacterium]